jgi:tetratricopeptide (TPR) repeat protein
VRVWLLLLSAAWAKSPVHAYTMINEWRVEEAEREVAELLKSHPKDPEVLFLDGNVDFLHGRYQQAAEKLREAATRDPRPGPFGDELRGLRDLAQATAEATRGFVEARGKHFVVSHAPGKDGLLVPYALDALDRAWEALGDDFGDKPEGLIRVEIYPEVADLAKVSTLTLQEIETSGTIALCKFNRLMIVSPRALLTGYPWLDTLTHEYTHFIVSRVSHNTVPIWLHEGLAKYEERRWHAPRSGLDEGKQGGGLTPTMEHLLASGLQKKRLITFAEMHPSMAKLPSQEDTSLAFAEVYMVIVYLEQSIGWNGVRQIVARLRDGKSVPEAVSAGTGKSFSEFQNDWRGWLAAQKLKLRPGLVPASLRFKKGKDKPDENDENDLINEEKARKLARLGGMLRMRHRLAAAAQEYEKAQALIGPGNLQVANKLARTWLELGDPERAVKAAEPALELYPDQAAPAATLGEAWMKKGDGDQAAPYFERSIAVSPFDPAAHCALKSVYQRRNDPRAAREEAACKALQ